MSLKENPCKNFVPNVFNKNKCLNCFKSRDTHLKSDKDLSKAKPIYGGWLLLAPIGTDFGNPAQKNRKWQRRWFVLFEHGALRYSLDNSETTVAQGTIDMNKCNDVTYAEKLTDQKHSLCVYLSDQRYYVRGECREDIMGWHDQLAVYPETNREEKKRKNRLNRNRQYGAPPPAAEDISKKPVSSPLLLRSRNSSSSSVRSPNSEKSDMNSPRVAPKKTDLIISNSHKTPRQEINSIGSNKNDANTTYSSSEKLDTSYFTIEKKQENVANDEKADVASPAGRLQRDVSLSTSSLDSTDSTDSSSLGNMKKKHLKDHRSKAESTKPKRQTASTQQREQRKDQEKRNKLRSPTRDDSERSFHDRKKATANGVDSNQADTSNKENDEPSLSDASHGDRGSTSTIAVASPVTSPQSTPRESSDREDKRGRTIARRSTNMKQGTQTESQPRSATELRRAKSLDRSAYNNINIAPDLFNSKKGWLQIQDDKNQWSKRWFVLGKGELNFFNSSAEDGSNPAGSIDISSFVDVTECDVQRNYGFQIKTATDTFVFSAMTPGIRRNWISAVSKSCTTEEVTPVVFRAIESVAKKPDEPLEPTTPTNDPDLSDASLSERSARRRARIRDRKKEGRSRTFDFGEIKPLTTPQAIVSEFEQMNKTGKRPDVKARSRTFDPETLLKEAKKIAGVDAVDGERRTDEAQVARSADQRSPAEVAATIDCEWKKVEQAIGIATTSPITQTATMVKALQSEVDSLKKQMERVHNEKNLNDELPVDDVFSYPNVQITSDSVKTQEKLDEQTSHIEKLKQELTSAQDSLRKQSAELRERDMQLEITSSETQVLDTRLTNLQNELHLEKSRREEAEKESVRTKNALNKELEDSEAKLKKSESLHLNAQRKIRELERSIHIHKDHNKEEELLQDHIGVLQDQVADQELEMREMQESFEDKCQQQKILEDRLVEAKDLIKTYEEQMHEMRESLKNTDKDVTFISAKSSNDQIEIRRLTEESNSLRTNETKLKERIEKLVAQSELDEDCNKSLQILQEELSKAKLTNQRLQDLLKEHDDDFAANEKQVEELSSRLKVFGNENESLRSKCQELLNENSKVKDQLEKINQSEQVVRDLRARLSTAEKKVGEIEAVRSRSASSSESSIRAKLSELEAEMGGTGQLIAARLQSLEPSRRVSDPSLAPEKESSSQKIHRLETELEKKLKDLHCCEAKLKEVEDQYKDNEVQYLAQINKLNETLAVAAQEHDANLSRAESNSQAVGERLSALHSCLGLLHRRVMQVVDGDEAEERSLLLQRVIDDVLKLSEGSTKLSDTPPRSPSPTADLSDRRWSRVTDDESRQQHQRAMTRLRQLTERLKNADGRLVSPVGSSSGLSAPSKSPSASSLRPKNLPISNQNSPLTDDASAQLFAKQIGAQALLLAEMAVTLRRSQSTQGHANRVVTPRQGSPSPQLNSAEFSDSNPALAGVIGGGLLEHVETLARKLSLEGVLMREISRLKESWLQNRSRTVGHRGLNSGPPPSSDFCSAVVTHAHVSYVLQIYNERISRLSLEAKQARHRADAATRKLRELVQACKSKDLNTISNLAVQVDLDTITSPYSDKPQWEQQVDYGTLHGAHSASASSSDAAHLDQEAIFFQHLADDLKCMSADVESLSRLGSQLVQTDAALQKCLLPSEIGEHASTVAREAIVQAEIIYISHRLRRDYDEELRKAKDAVSSQSQHMEALRDKMKQSDEGHIAKLKLTAEEHNAKVTRLMEDLEKLECARAAMSDDADERFTRLSKKYEQELKSCDVRHEQEKASLKKELSLARSELKASTKDYMVEVKTLKEKLDKIEVQHRKEIDLARSDYEKEIEKLRSSYNEDIETSKKIHEKEVRGLKSEFEKEFEEMEKEFSDKIKSIEESKTSEINDLKEQNRLQKKQNEADREKAANEIERNWLGKFETVKREFDEFLKQEKLKHQMEIKNVRGDAEVQAKEKYTQKMSNLKKDHEKLLERRDKLHQEQLEREKEVWLSECRQQWEAEREVAHSRSNSMTSETESKDALKARISDLEDQLNSVQGQLEDEQLHHDYQAQLNEIKALCDKSFTTINESHTKQLDDLKASHKREIERLLEEHSTELDTNNEDTRRVIEAMRKHHVDELRALRHEVRTGSVRNEPADVVKFKQELETLSEHLTRKCVELKQALEAIEKSEDKCKSLERENRLLQARQPPAIDEVADEVKLKRLSTSLDDNQSASDLYQLEVKLRVKKSEIDYLQQDVTSLKKQINEADQEIKQHQRKHKNMFEELTLSRSKEAMARREVSRFKDLLRRRSVYPDDVADSDDDSDSRDGSPRGYDFQKSRSQPDCPSTVLKPSLSLTSQPPPSSSSSSSSSSIKRRSSERTTRHAKV